MRTVITTTGEIPAVGFGTYPMKEDTCAEMVSAALDAGYRHIDTARMYGNEKEVGEGISASGVSRDDIFLTTKIWYRDIGSENLVRAAEASIEALGVGSVDLLLIHWQNPLIPIDESIAALNAARRAGLTRHIGVANFTSSMIETAVRASAEPLLCNQVEYHPRLSQKAVLAACRRNDMALIAYSPLGAGGSLLEDPVVVRIAAAHNRTPAQIVLRWAIEQPGVGAIPKTSRVERLRQNLAIFDFALTVNERSQLHEMTKRGERILSPSCAPEWDPA